MYVSFWCEQNACFLVCWFFSLFVSPCHLRAHSARTSPLHVSPSSSCVTSLKCYYWKEVQKKKQTCSCTRIGTWILRSHRAHIELKAQNLRYLCQANIRQKRTKTIRVQCESCFKAKHIHSPLLSTNCLNFSSMRAIFVTINWQRERTARYIKANAFFSCGCFQNLKCGNSFSRLCSCSVFFSLCFLLMWYITFGFF